VEHSRHGPQNGGSEIKDRPFPYSFSCRFPQSYLLQPASHQQSARQPTTNQIADLAQAAATAHPSEPVALQLALRLATQIPTHVGLRVPGRPTAANGLRLGPGFRLRPIHRSGAYEHACLGHRLNYRAYRPRPAPLRSWPIWVSKKKPHANKRANPVHSVV
jgi:hypothetical protein